MQHQVELRLRSLLDQVWDNLGMVVPFPSADEQVCWELRFEFPVRRVSYKMVGGFTSSGEGVEGQVANGSYQSTGMIRLRVSVRPSSSDFGGAVGPSQLLVEAHGTEDAPELRLIEIDLGSVDADADLLRALAQDCLWRPALRKRAMPSGAVPETAAAIPAMMSGTTNTHAISRPDESSPAS